MIVNGLATAIGRYVDALWLDRERSRVVVIEIDWIVRGSSRHIRPSFSFVSAFASTINCASAIRQHAFC
jgi:hypothetical protein